MSEAGFTQDGMLTCTEDFHEFEAEGADFRETNDGSNVGHCPECGNDTITLYVESIELEDGTLDDEDH